MTIRMKISLSALFLLPGLIPLYASEHSKAAVAAVERADDGLLRVVPGWTWDASGHGEAGPGAARLRRWVS